MYNAPSSASAADDITALMILEFVRMAPLFGGQFSSFDRKKFIVSCIGLAFLVAIELSAVRMVVSTALAYYKSVPATAWTYFVSFLERGGDSLSFLVYCVFAPYCGITCGCGKF